MYLTLYFLTTHLPDSFSIVRDHFLSLDPTKLTLASFESRLFEAVTSDIAVTASRGTPRSSFFEGCSPFLHAPSVAHPSAVGLLGVEEAGAVSAPSRSCNKSGRQKGKGGGGGVGGGGSGGGGGGGGGGEGGGGGGGGGLGGGGGGGGSGGGGSGRGGGGAGRVGRSGAAFGGAAREGGGSGGGQQ
ncbi:unnamed protein product [Closterium sp. NIES-53]